LHPRLALVFAVIGVCLLVSISFVITLHLIWLTILTIFVSIAFIGSGFVIKARTRKKTA